MWEKKLTLNIKNVTIRGYHWKKDKIKFYFSENENLTLIKKIGDFNEKYSAETKHLAKRLKKPVVPSFNCKGNGIQHEFDLNLIEDMVVLIHLIQKGSINRAVENMIFRKETNL